MNDFHTPADLSLRRANAQDGSGMNNVRIWFALKNFRQLAKTLRCSQANFATPPDGSRPRMRMYSWSGSQPYRDGDFEAGMCVSFSTS